MYYKMLQYLAVYPIVYYIAFKCIFLMGEILSMLCISDLKKFLKFFHLFWSPLNIMNLILDNSESSYSLLVVLAFGNVLDEI